MSLMKTCSNCGKSLQLRRRKINPDLNSMRCLDCNEPDKDCVEKEPPKSSKEVPSIGRPTPTVKKTGTQTIMPPGHKKHGVNGKVVGPEMYNKKKETKSFAPVIKETRKKKKKES